MCVCVFVCVCVCVCVRVLARACWARGGTLICGAQHEEQMVAGLKYQLQREIDRAKLRMQVPRAAAGCGHGAANVAVCARRR